MKILIHKSYGVFQLLWLLICLLFTKIFFVKARLIRLPIFLRGKSKIIFGERFTCGYLNRIDAFGQYGCINIGSDVQFNDFVHIGALESVLIGNNVLIASRVYISDHDHGCYSGNFDESSPLTPPSLRKIHSNPITIEDNVWIGENVSILAGSHIGRGSVIGAGAVVKGLIPNFSIVVGVPARVIKRFDFELGQWVTV